MQIFSTGEKFLALINFITIPAFIFKTNHAIIMASEFQF